MASGDGLHRYRVAREQAGKRADQFLKERLPGWSRRRIAAWFEAGKVLCNGRKARKGTILEQGDWIEVDLAAEEPEDVLPDPGARLRILWEDESLVAVDKPPCMPTHPLRPGETGTVANWLVARYPEMKGVGFSKREPGLLHRLDRGTSGILLAARTPVAFERLRAQFEQGRVVKTYWAVVHGSPPARGRVCRPIGARGRRGSRVLVLSEDSVQKGVRGVKEAETRFRVVRCFRDAALVRMQMTSGVRHQLRAHMAFLGHPVVGDVLYGGSTPGGPEYTGKETRHYLHAGEVRFYHPSDGRPMRIRSPLPADMRALLQGLPAAGRPTHGDG